MSRRARMFNRKASSPKSKPNEVVEVLTLQRGDRVADIGAGGGYFSLRFAEAVGAEGHVFAVDTSPELLEFVKVSASEKGLTNLETLLVREDSLTLPEGRVDLVFMRNVTHHLTNRVGYFRNLKGVLGRGGRVAIIEYQRPSRLSFRGMFGHYVPKETIIEEMERAGYRLQQDLDFLPEQSFTIYSFP